VDAGFKYNLTDLQAALGLVQLQKCGFMTELRQRIAERYNSAFGHVDLFEIPTIQSGLETSWHLYVLRLNLSRSSVTRDEFVARLKDCGVSTSVHFIPLHLHPYYQAAYGYKPGDFPVAEREFARYFSLPIYPGMTDDDVEYVIKCVLDLGNEVSL